MEPKRVEGLELNSLFNEDGEMVLSWGAVDSVPQPLGYNIYTSLHRVPKNLTKIASGIQIPQYKLSYNVYPRDIDSYAYVTYFTEEGESDYSFPISLREGYFKPTEFVNMNYILPEIVRRRGIMMRIGGEDCFYLLKKVAGDKCACYDPRRGYADKNCSMCFGSGIQGGYVSVKGTMRMLSANEKLDRQDVGIELIKQPTAHNVIWPLIKTGDIVVRKNNQRYRIQDVLPGITNGVITRQTFTLSEVNINEPIYQIPVNPCY